VPNLPPRPPSSQTPDAAGPAPGRGPARGSRRKGPSADQSASWRTFAFRTWTPLTASGGRSSLGRPFLSMGASPSEAVPGIPPPGRLYGLGRRDRPNRRFIAESPNEGLVAASSGKRSKPEAFLPCTPPGPFFQATSSGTGVEDGLGKGPGQDGRALAWHCLPCCRRRGSGPKSAWALIALNSLSLTWTAQHRSLCTRGAAGRKAYPFGRAAHGLEQPAFLPSGPYESC
jgi:hypothetical protein